MNAKSLCTPTTTIIDFAYDEGHVLRQGNFPTSTRSSFASDAESEAGLFLRDEINLRAIALFDFTPENDNEVELKTGQVIRILYRFEQGWLVAENPRTGENGLVPEEYVEMCDDDHVFDELPKPFLPLIFHDAREESEWEDTEEEPDGGEDPVEALGNQLRETGVE